MLNLTSMIGLCRQRDIITNVHVKQGRTGTVGISAMPGGLVGMWAGTLKLLMMMAIEQQLG